MEQSNHAFIYDWIIRNNASRDKIILDFGSGNGDLVEYLRKHGLNVVGADPYPKRYKAWHTESPHLHQITNQILPFDDETIDMVVSNQVFEHIGDYTKELKEIHRVLKPDGTFLALFPTLETAYEVHSGIWGAYYLKNYPKLLYAWLYIWRRCGAGLWHQDHTVSHWAKLMCDVIINECHYKSLSKIKKDWKKAFSVLPQTHLKDYLDFRIQRSRFSFLKPVFMAFAPLITLVRSGVIISVKK